MTVPKQVQKPSLARMAARALLPSTAAFWPPRI